MTDRDWPEEVVERLADIIEEEYDVDVGANRMEGLHYPGSIARAVLNTIASDPDVLKALLGEPVAWRAQEFGTVADATEEVRLSALRRHGYTLTALYTLPEQSDDG